MLRRILFLLIYILAWISIFELARIYFIFSTWKYAGDSSANLVLQSLWYGLKMDLSMASYLVGPICLFTILGLYLRFFRKQLIYNIYTGVILFLQLFLILSDAEIYKAWRIRIDFTPLKYLSSPREMWASISYLPVFWIILGFILIYLLLFWTFRKLLSKSFYLLSDTDKRAIQSVVVLLFMGLLIIPIRGGFQLSPLNQSSVYFSNKQYANNAAVNASWNFMYSVTLMNQLKNNPYEYMSDDEANTIMRSLYEQEGTGEQILKTDDSTRINVIFVIWESFTAKALTKKVNNIPVIKYFPELVKEGIYFSNCYSSGDRTDKGISSILSSYPALPKGSIVNYPEKTALLPGLGNLFLQNGYSTHFYYGGEPEFANIKSYLTAQLFQQMITKDDFAHADMNSKWGAHDDVVMKRLLGDISEMKEPFFTTWLTLSSHEPFETPVPTVLKGKDIETRFLNSLHYTDSVVYTFIMGLKKLPLWKNTVVVISADHGHYLPIIGKRADDFRIPVMWLGGALKNKNMTIDKTVSQLDIAGSLINQFHFAGNPFPFSKNVFNSSSKHWAFFTFNNGIGYVTDSSRIIFDNEGKRLVFKEGRVGNGQERIVQALMQSVYSDFLKK